jgi:hypothetical protein
MHSEVPHSRKNTVLLIVGILVCLGAVTLLIGRNFDHPQPKVSVATKQSSSAGKSAGSSDTAIHSTADAASSTNTTPAQPAPDAAPLAASTVEAPSDSNPFTPDTAQAEISLKSGTIKVSCNQVGNFQRIVVGPEEQIPVKVNFPDAQPGDAVAVEVKDGGHMNVSDMAKVLKLDTEKTLQFKFQPTAQAGIYRIALRKGAKVRVLNFWVGPETEFRNDN